MDGDTANVYEKLESKSIIPSKDLIIPDDATLEPQLKYLLDNLLSEMDMSNLSNKSSSSDKISPRAKPDDLKNYLEKTKELKFIERYSSFSLIPDGQVDSKMTMDASRLGALENIINEEKTRISNQSGVDLHKSIEHRRLSSMDYNKRQEPSKEMATFMRLNQKLENLKRYCPKLYHTDADIISIWGNMVKEKSDSFTIRKN